jgi:hypothetical protein
MVVVMVVVMVASADLALVTCLAHIQTEMATAIAVEGIMGAMVVPLGAIIGHTAVAIMAATDER